MDNKKSRGSLFSFLLVPFIFSVGLLTSHAFAGLASPSTIFGDNRANAGESSSVSASYSGTGCGDTVGIYIDGACSSSQGDPAKAYTGGCGGVSKSTTIKINSGATTACIVRFGGQASCYDCNPSISTGRDVRVRVNQKITWLSAVNATVPIQPDAITQLSAVAKTTDGVSETATVQNTKLKFRTLTPLVCSSTEWGDVKGLSEGSCKVEAYVEQTDDLAPVSSSAEWSFYYPDSDKDGIKDNTDICPNDFDPAQTDTDGSGIGDACNSEHDPDNDEYEYNLDLCPNVSNPDQKDSDKSGVGDACNNDIDTDNDEWENTRDNCETIYNPGDVNGIQADADNDGLGDACDIDTDFDGILDAYDNCPAVPNADQKDTNKDSIGDVCAVDGDSDGIDDKLDNCVAIANPSQLDSNKNGLGNACEVDTDDDGIPDDSGAQKDNCPRIKNADQEDSDGNGRGDACEVAFVATSGSDAHDCLSWVNACKTLQVGIDAAVSHDLPQVFVKMGAYKPATPINLKSGVKLIGGFEGKDEETLSTDANSSGNLTIITADGEYPNGDTLMDGVTATVAEKAGAANRGTLLSAKDLPSGSANRTTVMGFTINASQDSALLVDNAGVELINVKFVANEAADGAAIKAINGASVKMNSVVFNNNAASGSAVVYVNDSDLTATQTTFEYNLGASGSAIVAEGASKVNIDLSHFDQNVSTGNGTILTNGSATQLKITNTDFKQNTAANGGAVYIANAASFITSNTLFENNHTSSGVGGAVVLAGSAASEIKQSSFIGNTAFTHGGAIATLSGASATVENVTFTHNKAGAKADGAASGENAAGGAIDATGTNMSVDIKSSTFAGNEASQKGGALAINSAASGSLKLAGNLMAGNMASTGANIAAASGKIVDGGYNLLGFNGVSGLSPSNAINFSASSSFIGTAALLTDILEVDPTRAGGDGYGSSLPMLPIQKASEARDVIPAGSCPTDVDQRGEERSGADGFCDIGAYQYTLLSCTEDAQRRQENGEDLIKYCAPGFEEIEFSLGQVGWYFYALLTLLFVARIRLRRK